MKELYVSPVVVAPWEHRNTTDFYLGLAKQNRLRESEFAPVFRMDYSLNHALHLQWKYVILDGHNKREAAYRAHLELPKKRIVLPIRVIEKPADFALIPDYNQPEDVNMDRHEFKEMVREYSERAIEFHLASLRVEEGTTTDPEEAELERTLAAFGF